MGDGGGSGRNLVVLSGPSGTGKTTVVRTLLQVRPDLAVSTSATTRPPRPGEVDGRDYYFLSEATFRERVAAGGFVEWAEVFGRLYGTPVEELDRAAAAGKRLLLEIDVQGGLQIKRKFPEATAILLLAPSAAVQRERLAKRGTEAPEDLERRFAKAQEEVGFARAAGCDDAEVVNDDRQGAVRDGVRILEKRRNEA